MKDQLYRIRSKPLFIVLSLFFIGMTIALTVAQTMRPHDLRSSAASEFINCTVSDDLLANDSEEESVTRLINDFRVQNNLAALTTDLNLNRAAAWQSKDMAGRGNINHTDTSGRDPLTRVVNCGFSPIKAFGENLAKGQTTAQQVFEGWKSSSEHKANMLCPNCTRIGIARDRVNGGDWYWTLDVALTTNIQEPTSPPNNSLPTATPSAEVTQVPTETPEVTLPPAHTSIPNGKTGILIAAKIVGIDNKGNGNPHHPNRKVTVTITKPEGSEVAKVNDVVSYNRDKELFFGAIELPDSVETGTYIVKVKTDKSITKVVSEGFTNIEKGKLTELPPVSLPPVDFNGDNAVTYTDIIYYAKCLDKKTCAKAETDLDDDGSLTISDYDKVMLRVFSDREGQ